MIKKQSLFPERLFHWLKAKFAPWQESPRSTAGELSITTHLVEINGCPVLLRMIRSNIFTMLSFEYKKGQSFQPLISVVQGYGAIHERTHVQYFTVSGECDIVLLGAISLLIKEAVDIRIPTEAVSEQTMIIPIAYQKHQIGARQKVVS